LKVPGFEGRYRVTTGKSGVGQETDSQRMHVSKRIIDKEKGGGTA